MNDNKVSNGIFADCKKPQSEYNEALQRALRYITATDKTEHEVRKKLMSITPSCNLQSDKQSSDSFSDETIDSVIEFLKENNYINDRRYAEYYIVCYKEKRSVNRIKADLAKRGISDQIILECLEEAEISSLAACQKALEKQLRRRFPGETPNISELNYQDRCKIMSSLASQGFSSDEIRRTMEEMGG